MLAGAMPILHEATTALDTLKPADISYIKGLKNPPPAIKLVMEAVCVILDVKPAKAKDEQGKAIDDYWKPSLGLLTDKVGPNNHLSPSPLSPSPLSPPPSSSSPRLPLLPFHPYSPPPLSSFSGTSSSAL